MTRKALSLNGLKKRKESLALYDSLLPKLRTLDAGRFRWLVAQTMFNRAADLSNLRRPSEALAAYDEFIGLFGEAGDGWTQVLVAGSLLSKASILRGLGRTKEAIAACDRLIELYGDSQHFQIVPSVKKARELKGDLLQPEDPPATNAKTDR